ncbi:MAG TPA: manganese efflux pump [Chthonomonadales bacterium]|nr:manganese efflux pump [Chthonomonadales bacterium]
MNWLAIAAISLANNLDNTGVGLAYGLAGIELRPLVNLWISVITYLITMASVLSGSRISRHMPAAAANGLSAAVLCGIGLWMLLPFIKRYTSHISGLGALLREPQRADRDRSSHIDFQEATVLAVALSINNVGGGFSAGLIGLSAGWVALSSAAVSCLVLWGGGLIGSRFGTSRLGERATISAALLLIAIGLNQLRPK